MNIQHIRNELNAIRAAIKICEDKAGIEKAATIVNLAWENAGEPAPLPVGEYRRYSWLMADLTRMQTQLTASLRDAEFAEGYPVDEESGCDIREWCGNDINAAHAEALEINAVVDRAVSIASCYADSDSATPNAINRAIDHTRGVLLNMNRYNARFIVKMMISVRRIAKEARQAAKARYQEMLTRCAAAGQGCSEIPF